MSIKIGNIDLGKSVIELEYQTKLNSLLIELLLNRSNTGITQDDIESLKQRAAESVNNKYGKEMISIKK